MQYQPFTTSQMPPDLLVPVMAEFKKLMEQIAVLQDNAYELNELMITLSQKLGKLDEWLTFLDKFRALANSIMDNKQ